MAKKDAKASTRPSKPSKQPNPVWRMMGLPNFHFRLPSRNWMIFLTITGSWTAAVLYDRREKKRIQRKWTKLVEHIAQEPLDTHQLPRKLSVYMSAPPADGLVPARNHFHEYVKPILVVAALDWDAVEGRKEGDVQAGLAERIRRFRRKMGEQASKAPESDLEEVLEESRRRAGVLGPEGTAGDIVIGRHAWKEYVRGLHEGWLGPLDPPEQLDATQASALIDASSISAQDASPPPSIASPADDASPTAIHENPASQELEKSKEEENKHKMKKQPLPYNSTADYSISTLSPNCPSELPPAAVIPLPHLLGFLNFPIRMYRFLNRRKVADEIGRQTAAAVLAAYRPFDGPGELRLDLELENAKVLDDEHGPRWEQERLLRHEESEWHKSVLEHKDGYEKERVWMDDMVLDSRIAGRMRKFELSPEAEDQANKVAIEKEEPWWKSIWPNTEKKKEAWEDL
ncbi:mitochondrial import inner membrane translocase subunit tim54, partial [Lojkania enalia]